MKTKKFRAKMALNKTTVANLDNHEMNAAEGGVISKFQCSVYITNCWTECTYCNSCNTECQTCYTYTCCTEC
jgi:hypothetical protein